MNHKKHVLSQRLLSLYVGLLGCLLFNLVFITAYAEESQPKIVAEPSTALPTAPPPKPPKPSEEQKFLISRHAKIGYTDFYDETPAGTGYYVHFRVWDFDLNGKPELVQVFNATSQETERVYDFNSDGVPDKVIQIH